MPKAMRWTVVLVIVLVWASFVQACPVCNSETGCQVRAGIFNEEFGPKLFLTLLPFPVFLGIVAAIHFGFPFCPRNEARARSKLAEAREPELAPPHGEVRS